MAPPQVGNDGPDSRKLPSPVSPQRLRAYPTPTVGGLIYVDPTTGSDAAAGSLAAPVKTLAHAQTLAREVYKPATILLRGGVYYLGETLALTPDDSGLTIQAYNGEHVVISGAVPLRPVTWEPYNVTSGASTTMSAPIPDMNLVSGATYNKTTAQFTFFGVYPSVDGCSAICLATLNCSAYTWHDTDQPAGSTQWDGECYGVTVRAATSV